MMMILYLDIFR